VPIPRLSAILGQFGCLCSTFRRRITSDPAAVFPFMSLGCSGKEIQPAWTHHESFLNAWIYLSDIEGV
jgi:hypothetical protein